MKVPIVTNIGTVSGILLTLSFSVFRVFGLGLTFLHSFKVVSVVKNMKAETVTT